MQGNHVHNVKLYLWLIATVVALMAATVVWMVIDASMISLALLVIASFCLYMALTAGTHHTHV